MQENTDMTEQDDTGGIRSQTSTKQEETSVYYRGRKRKSAICGERADAKDSRNLSGCTGRGIHRGKAEYF